MIIQLALYTETNKGNISRTRGKLLEMGLVYGRLDPRDPNSPTEDDVIVWEDPNEHIGRYRVHLRENEEMEDKKQDVLDFHYWMNERCMNRDIFHQDPMALAIREVLPILEGKIEIKKWNMDVAPIQQVIDYCFPEK